MIDPLSFTLECLGSLGALVDPTADGGIAVLPPALAQSLGTPEELQLVAGAAPPGFTACGFGTPLLERLIQDARAGAPVAWVRLDARPPIGCDMTDRKRPEDASLLDVLIDGFEKNEVLDGFHRRDLPMGDDDAAARKFAAFAEEAERWKGPPLRREAGPVRWLAGWPDLEIRQAGRAVRVRIRPTSFHDWWNEPATWDGDPMGPISDWIDEEVEPNSRSS